MITKIARSLAKKLDKTSKMFLDMIATATIMISSNFPKWKCFQSYSRNIVLWFLHQGELFSVVQTTLPVSTTPPLPPIHRLSPPTQEIHVNLLRVLLLLLSEDPGNTDGLVKWNNIVTIRQPEFENYHQSYFLNISKLSSITFTKIHN